MRIATLLLLPALSFIGTGCITQEKYNALRLERDALNEQLSRAQQDTIAARTQATSWKGQLDQVMAGSGNSSALAINQQQQISNLQAQLSDITAKYNEAITKIGQGQPLPVALTNELTKFADANPDLVEFDEKKGTIKFKSDVTFASGDAQLTPAAADVIQKFAAILNSPAAKGYELLVAGHADNQPVSAGTQARGHLNNWYLSSHRALSVASALTRQGIAPRRIGAVGYGEYRPVADNANKAGMAMNRRVEVLLLPTQIADAPGAVAAPAVAAPIVEPAKPELNK
jgi:chemotaxis protein MotB